MLEQILTDIAPHGIKNKINAFSSRQLCGRNKVAISGNKDDLIDLLFICERSNIDADFHINAFLLRIEFKIILCQGIQGSLPGKKGFRDFWLKVVIHVVGKMPQTKSKFPHLLKLVKESGSPRLGIGLVEVNIFPAQGMIYAPAPGRFTVIVKYAVE